VDFPALTAPSDYMEIAFLDLIAGAVMTRPHEVSPAASPCAGEDGKIKLYHRGVRELEPRAHLMESEI